MKDTLSNQQWRIMETLWSGSPMYLSELRDALAGEVQWTHTTFLTYLKQLVRKGYVTYEVMRGSRRYSPAVTREDCVQQASRSLLSRMTDSSAALFVSHMIREGSLSRKDRNNLRSLIDQLSEEDDDQ